MKRFLLTTLAALSLAVTAAAGPVTFDDGWKQQKFSLFSQNRYGYRGDTLTVQSDGSVSLTYKPLPQADWSAQGASWFWSVSQSVPATNLSRKGGDDRNLALYFVFLPTDRAAAMQGSGLRQLLGDDSVRVLVYVWGGAESRGSMLDSPYLGARGKTVVLRPAGTGQATENVNLARDFGRAFGGRPGALVGIAISADSDDTDSVIAAQVSSLSVQ